MKRLERNQMKNLVGGVAAPPVGYVMSQSGWILQGSNCYCDYRHVFEDGTVFNACYIQCPTMCCSAGMGCSLSID